MKCAWLVTFTEQPSPPPPSSPSSSITAYPHLSSSPTQSCAESSHSLSLLCRGVGGNEEITVMEVEQLRTHTHTHTHTHKKIHRQIHTNITKKTFCVQSQWDIEYIFQPFRNGTVWVSLGRLLKSIKTPSLLLFLQLYAEII